MESMAHRHFCRSCLTLSLSSTQEHGLTRLVQALPEGETSPEWACYETGLPRSLGLRIPARSSFSAQGDSLKRMGEDFDAGYQVGEQIISLDYLWNKVRVQGGAYGTRLSVSQNGTIYSYSYRDPSPAASLDANLGAGAYLVDFCERGEDITPYIISTIAKSEPLESPCEKGLSADNAWFLGLDQDDFRRMRREMLETGAAKLRRFAGILNRFAAEGERCVVGHDEALKACEGLNVTDL